MKRKVVKIISITAALAILVSAIAASGLLFGAAKLEGSVEVPSEQLGEDAVIRPNADSIFDGSAKVEINLPTQPVEDADETLGNAEFSEIRPGSDANNSDINDTGDASEVEEGELKAPVLPEEEEYTFSNYRITGFREIKFDEMFPAYMVGDTSWDPMGVDDNGIIYFGYTGRRTDLADIEDFAVFSYDPEADVIKFLGSFIEASKASNNYQYGESIPKGHTKFYCIDNKMYMASQGFHDFKNKIDGYESYRGAHLYAYDIEKGVLVDVSADMPGGVWCESEGVVSMNYVEELNMLVGFTHPLANLVFYDLETNTVDRFVEGIPWVLGNPLSREMIVSGDRIYIYRGVEDSWRADEMYPMYYYDYGDDKLVKTDQMMGGGFWNGQEITSDGKTAYISGCCSWLYKLDLETGKVTFLADMGGGDELGYTYSITLSPDETKLFYVPTTRNPGLVYEYDIATGKISTVYTTDNSVYCGSSIITSDDWYYFTRFGVNGSWEGSPTLVAFKLEPWSKNVAE